MPISRMTARNRYARNDRLMTSQYRYRNEAATSLPTSRLAAMIMTAVAEPMKSRPSPRTEKNAEQPAMKNAAAPMIYLNPEGRDVAPSPPRGFPNNGM